MALTNKQKVKIVLDVLRVQRENSGTFDNISLTDLFTSIDNLDAWIGTNAIAINNEFATQTKANLTTPAKNAMFTGVSTAKFG